LGGIFKLARANVDRVFSYSAVSMGLLFEAVGPVEIGSRVGPVLLGQAPGLHVPQLGDGVAEGAEG
jgi:hypothetical protein